MTADLDNADDDPIVRTDLSTLTREQLHDYRLELTDTLVFHPESEGLFWSKKSRVAYIETVQAIKLILGDDS